MRSTGEINFKPTTSIAAILLEFRQARRGGGEEATQGNKGRCKRGKEENQPNKQNLKHTHKHSLYISDPS